MRTYWFTVKYFSRDSIEEVTVARKTANPDCILNLIENNVRGYKDFVSLIDSFYTAADLG